MAKGIGWLRRFAARFYYRRHGWPEPQDREVDLTLGHPQAGVLLQHIAARRWAECESLFMSLRADERFVLLGFCARQGIPADLLDAWTTHSTSFVAGLFRGTALTHAAWDARGAGPGADVSEDGGTRFASLLEESWNLLIAAHESAPHEPEPLVRLIPVAMGLETGADDIRNLVTRCVNTGVPHLGAALYAAEALSGKWLGSPEESLEFARAHADQHPRERVVIACAHVENWQWEGMQYEDRRSESYFKRPEVQRDLRECWGRETEIGTRTDYFRFHALNYYAFCLLLMEDDELLREALEYMGAGITPKPWIYSTDKPVLVVNTARLHEDLPAL